MAKDPILVRFRKILRQTKSPTTICERSIIELEQDAERVVRLYLGKSKPIRPSRQAQEFNQMAKGLARAAKAMEELGPNNLDALLNLVWANSDVDGVEIRQHIDYVARLAIYAKRAAKLMEDETRTTGDNKGGRPPDENLRNLVLSLMNRFEAILAIRPTHSADTETGLGVSPFDVFVKEAIARHASEDNIIEPRRIDDATRWALTSRDIIFYEPPKLPEN